jgi:penicillin-binding protein 2
MRWRRSTARWPGRCTDCATPSTGPDSNRISTRLLAPPRGRLIDRYGVPVADNNQNWRATIIAEQTDDAQGTLDAFARIIPLTDHDRARIDRELRRRRRFIPVTVRDFLTWEEMARIEVAAPDLPGIVIDIGSTRHYPFGEELAHVVGYVAPPNEGDMGQDPMLALPGIRVGRNGLEKFHELKLRGRAGAVQLEVNAVGRVIRELAREEGTPGQDIQLTIDAVLQQKVIGHLGEESASAVVLDARNGEVLAMATNPSFDPTLFNSGVTQAQWVEWTNNRRAPLINKAIDGLYPPGSTFKTVVAMAALHAGSVSATDRINCPGYLDLGDTRFHCWKTGGHGLLDMRDGIKNSCDVFFYETARRTGIDPIAAMAKNFGLGVPLDIDLPGARSGFVPTREWRIAHGKPWNVGDTIVHGIGQGFTEVTPLSLAVTAARLATGRAVQPHLTRAVGGIVQAGARADTWPELGLPGKWLDLVRQGMWAVVNEQGGTAPAARLGLPDKSDTLPWELRPHALFIAFAPSDAPRYALSVVVEHGNAGAEAAAPIARDIMLDVLDRDPSLHPDQPSPEQRVAAGKRPMLSAFSVAYGAYPPGLLPSGWGLGNTGGNRSSAPVAPRKSPSSPSGASCRKPGRTPWLRPP